MNEQGAIGPELLVELRRDDGAPLRAQLEAGLRAAIRAGRMTPGARLPASRVLARDLGVSRRLVVEAYEQLRAEGYLEARTGAGTFVRTDGTAAPTPPRRRPAGRSTRPRCATTSSRAPPTSRPSRAPTGCAPRARHCAACPTGLSDIPMRAVCLNCAPSSPATCAGCAAWSPNRTASSSSPARSRRWP